MKYQMLLMCYIISSVISAPVQMILEPMQQQLMQDQLLRQMLDLHEIQSLQEMQNLQNLQQLKALQMSYQMPIMNFLQPITPIVVVPVKSQVSDIEIIDEQILKRKQATMMKDKSEVLKNTNEYGDDDSMTIDADSLATDSEQRKALFFFAPKIPQGRFSIGGIIGAIPFLPIEVNVPDTISWIWNGIGSIIGGIGQASIFRPISQPMTTPSTSAQPQPSTKLLTHSRNQMIPVPFVLLPMQYDPIVQP